MLYDGDSENVGETEAALRTIADRIAMTAAQIRADLELGRRFEFEDTALSQAHYKLVR